MLPNIPFYTVTDNSAPPTLSLTHPSSTNHILSPPLLSLLSLPLPSPLSLSLSLSLPLSLSPSLPLSLPSTSWDAASAWFYVSPSTIKTHHRPLHENIPYSLHLRYLRQKKKKPFLSLSLFSDSSLFSYFLLSPCLPYSSIYQPTTMTSSPPSPLSLSDQHHLLEKLQIFKIQGRDKRGHQILCITGKLFPARYVCADALKSFLEQRIFVALGDRPFSVVYLHTDVQRSENFPGISTLRSIYDALPINIKDHLQAVYFVHPGLQSRLFLATFGRFIFSGGLYGKLKYVTRLEFLWDHVRRNEIEIPEFVYDHDEELEHRPMMDYGPESDHPRAYGGAPTLDSTVSMYSTRCIA